MVEDLFKEDDYKPAIIPVTSSTTHKDFRCMTKTTAEKIKEYIQNNYASFTDYSRFKPVLEKLISAFDLT